LDPESAFTLHEVFAEFRRQKVAEGCGVHRARLAGEGEEFAVAAEQAGDVTLEGAGFGAVEAVAGAGGADAGAAFLGAGTGAFAAVQAAAAVAHGGGAARAAGAAGARAAPWGEVGVAAWIAVAEGTGALTLYGVIPHGAAAVGVGHLCVGGWCVPHLTLALSAPIHWSFRGAEMELRGPLTLQGVLR
jgi:hypothetical protein